MLFLLFLMLSCSRTNDLRYRNKELTQEQINGLTPNNFCEVASNITAAELSIAFTLGNILPNDLEYKRILAKSKKGEKISDEEQERLQNPKDRDSCGKTLLMISALFFNMEAVRCCVDNRSKLTEKDSHDHNIFHLLAKYDSEEAVVTMEELIKTIGGHANIKGEGDITPLYVATTKSNCNMARLLMKYNADPEIAYNNGISSKNSIQVAILGSSLEMVKILKVSEKVNPDQIASIITACSSSLSRERLEIAKYLISTTDQALQPGMNRVLAQYEKSLATIEQEQEDRRQASQEYRANCSQARLSQSSQDSLRKKQKTKERDQSPDLFSSQQ